MMQVINQRQGGSSFGPRHHGSPDIFRYVLIYVCVCAKCQVVTAPGPKLMAVTDLES